MVAKFPVDAALVWPNGKAFFFRNNLYFRYDIENDSVDSGYPLPFNKTFWHGLPDSFASGIDAAVLWPNGKAFFFKGDKYIRFDVEKDKVDTGYPKPFNKTFWHGLPDSFASGIDAAILWPNGKAFLFKGNKYIRFDVEEDKVDSGYPKLIKTGWVGFPDSFASGIDAAILWPNGKAFFFKGDEYIRFDINTDKVDPGYPKSIVDNWPGLGRSYITSSEAECIIKNGLNGKTTSNFKLYLGDVTYFCYPLEEAKAVIASTTVDTYNWTAEKFDCDDFAFVLKAEFNKNSYEDKQRRAAACCGMLWGTGLHMNGTGSEPVHHAINWMINDDLKLRFVEPQSDKIYFPSSKDNGIYFMVT